MVPSLSAHVWPKARAHVKHLSTRLLSMSLQKKYDAQPVPVYEPHNSDSPPGKDSRLDGSNDDGSKAKLEGLNFSGKPKVPGSC